MDDGIDMLLVERWGCHIHTCVYCRARWICSLDHSNGVRPADARSCPDCRRQAWGELQMRPRGNSAAHHGSAGK